MALVFGAAPGSGTVSLTVGSTVISGGTSGRVLYNNAGVLGSAPLLVVSSTQLQLGAADAASPSAYTLNAQNVVAGTTDTAGVDLTIAGSRGTGTGIGGSILFKVAPAGSTGSSQNALVTAMTLDGATGKAIFPVGTVTNRSINIGIAGQWGSGINVDQYDEMSIVLAGSKVSHTSFGKHTVARDHVIGWSDSQFTPVNGGDVAFSRLAAGSLALGTGAFGSVGGSLSLTATTLVPAAAPSAPASGWTIYVDSGDSNKLKAIAANGTIVTLGTP